jgi:hypothetical protein
VFSKNEYYLAVFFILLDRSISSSAEPGINVNVARQKRVRTGAGQAKDAYIAILIDPSRTDFKVSRAYGKELQLWGRLVGEFTLKGLTFGRDKLPALSGIASRMPREILGDCLAGV